MTMPDVASALVTVPTDGARNRGRPTMPNSSPDQAADADFGKHLAGMAAGDDRTGQSAASREDREPPVACRRQWGDVDRVLVLDQGWGGDAEAAAAKRSIVGEDGSEAAALPPAGPGLVDAGLAAVAASLAALPPDTAGVSAKSLPPAGKAVDRISMPPSTPADVAEPPRARDAMPISQVRTGVQTAGMGAAASVQALSIVSRETHLAPSTPPAAVRLVVGRVVGEAAARAAGVPASKGAAADVRAPTDAMPAPDVEAKPPAPHPIVVAARSKEAGQGPAQGLPGKPPTAQGSSRAQSAAAGAGLPPQAPAAEAGSRRQAAPAEEALLDAPPASRGASQAGQDAQPSPQPPFSPARQIADSIVADVRIVGEQGRTDPVNSLPKAPAAQLKVLTVQLHPAELGAVTVRIALKNDVLELQIETGRRDTARLVDADRETLSQVLRSAGYSVEAMTVRAVEPPSPAASAGSSPASPDGAPQSQAGGSQPDARPSGGRAHAERDGNLHGTRRDSNDEQNGSRHRTGDGLYV